MVQRLRFLLDTSPLITLATFKVENRLIIDILADALELHVASSVADEGTANPKDADAQVIWRLLSQNKLLRVTPDPSSLDKTVDAYTKLGQGERDTLRVGLADTDSPIVLDDYLAFVIATRFGIKPILLLDLIVMLAEKKILKSALASDIVESIQARYSLPFVEHTRVKLKALNDDTANPP
jgi:predicted nucleic acid-binding protein